MNQDFTKPPTFDKTDPLWSEPEPMPNTFYIARCQDVAEARLAEGVRHVKSLFRCGIRDAKAISGIVNLDEQLVRDILRYERRSK